MVVFLKLFQKSHYSIQKSVHSCNPKSFLRTSQSKTILNTKRKTPVGFHKESIQRKVRCLTWVYRKPYRDSKQESNTTISKPMAGILAIWFNTTICKPLAANTGEVCHSYRLQSVLRWGGEGLPIHYGLFSLILMR